MPVLRLEGAVLGMTAISDTPDAPLVASDPGMIAVFAEVVFAYCEGFAPVRALAEKGGPDAPPHTPFLAADGELAAKLAIQAEWASGAGMALFVAPGTVAAPGDARAESIVQTQVVLVDLDHGDIAAKRDHLVLHLGQPTLEVASGGITVEGQRKLHLYWRLTEPAEGDDIARACRARHMIATKVGGDPAFRSAHQPIRVAGSVHAKGGVRRLVEILHHDPRDCDLGELIEAVVAMPPMEGIEGLDFNAASDRGQVTELFGRKVREGGLDGTTRFEALSRIIGYWIRRVREGHVSEREAWDEIQSYNAARIEPPWPEDKLRTEAARLWKRDAARYGADDTGTADDAADDGMPGGGDGGGDGALRPVRLTEDALADAFAERHADSWRFVAAWGQWLTWTGRLWKREDTLEAYDRARRICREAAVSSASARTRAKLSSASTVSAVERLARADRRHAATTDPWDRDPWLINTPVDVVDLRTGAGQPHDPALFMTRIAGASVSGACPTWLGFLETVTGGDAELQDYLQRMAGYCLTGVTSEHALFFLYGTGANGKSVFANTLAAIAEDAAWYCWHASRRQAMLEACWEKAGAFVHQQIIWVKDRGVLTRSHYLWKHEPCFMGWRRPNRPPKVAEETLPSTWEMPSFTKDERPDHPTPKPLDAFGIPMRQHVARGGLCYEPFSGSGSQIMAGEANGRRVFAMEISPAYVDVAVERWQAETGRDAILDGDGRTFAQVRTERIGDAPVVPADPTETAA